MNTKTAAPVIITASLVVLMSGCAGAAAQGGQVHDDLSPAANAAIGLAHGHVIVRDDLSPTRGSHLRQSVEQAATSWSDAARREFHSQPNTVERAFSPAEIRELKGSAPVDVVDDLSPLHSDTSTPAPQPDTVDDDLSPLRGAR